MKTRSETGFSVIELVLVLFVLLILGYTGWQVYQRSHVAVEPSEETKSNVTNQWVAKGTTANWSDAKNWSLGTPKNGQNLEFSTDNFAGATDGGRFTDDMKGLKIGHLTILGKRVLTTGVAFNLSGEALTITGGFSDELSTGTNSIFLNNDIVFDGNQKISEQASSMLYFKGKSMDIGNSVVSFRVSGTKMPDGGGIEIDTPLSGSGTIDFSGQTFSLGIGYTGETPAASELSSPKFTGMVLIEKDSLAQMRGSGALGNASISVKDGGTLSLNAYGTKSATLSNDLTLNGAGAPNSSDNPTGSTHGALTACLTSAQQGCEPGSTVTLSGKVILAGDTQVGAEANCAGSGCQAPASTTVTYKFPNLSKGSYALTPVAGSMAKISQ